METGEYGAVHYKTYKQGIKGVDCGKNTWINMYADYKHLRKNISIGTAGRQIFNMKDTRLPHGLEEKDFTRVVVGKYDSQIMPAATLWRGNCENLPQRYFYNEKDAYPGDYDISDILYRIKDIPDALESVTLRPGYKITLYAQAAFKGESEEFNGKYQEGGEKDERLLC